MTSFVWFVALCIGGVGGALNAVLSDHARLLPSIVTLTPGGTRVVRIGIVGNILTGMVVTLCLFWAIQAAGSTLNANGSYVYSPNGAFDALLTGQTATDSFSYGLTNGTSATVTVTVRGVEPIAGDAGSNVLNGTTGANVGTLNLGSGVISGGIFPLNMIGAADDGAIYAANLVTTNAIDPNNGHFRVYRWASETAAAPTIGSATKAAMGA